MGRTVINVVRTCGPTRLLYRLFGNKTLFKLRDMMFKKCFITERSKGNFVRENLKK